MLILCDFPARNKTRGRMIFFITERVRNEVHYEISSMYTKNIFYVEDLLTGDMRGLYTSHLQELVQTEEEYLQLYNHFYHKL
jgi:hypothetical protein